MFLYHLEIQLILEFKDSFGKYHPVLKDFWDTLYTFDFYITRGKNDNLSLQHKWNNKKKI